MLWWSKRTDKEHVDMSFITPLITTIQNVSIWWYFSVCKDKRYEGLMRTLNIPAPTAPTRYMYYRAYTYNVFPEDITEAVRYMFSTICIYNTHIHNITYI